MIFSLKMCSKFVTKIDFGWLEMADGQLLFLLLEKPLANPNNGSMLVIIYNSSNITRSYEHLK